MSINKWRLVVEETEYSGYQCLNCYKEWFGSSPVNWKYCPHCATQWEGEHVWEKKYYRLKKQEKSLEYKILSRFVFKDHTSEWKPDYYIRNYNEGIDCLKLILSDWREALRDAEEYNLTDNWRAVQLKLVAISGDDIKTIFEYMPELKVEAA